ncbi:TLD family protein [Aspergillus niger]|uniref:TLD family protein n=1 Tax=Aspergillus niger TaxID=5061 RepID=A0A505IDE1_ASPNG|nr:TLD family protein [Aspergillus niger]
MDTTVISEGLKPVFPETASLWDRAIGDVFICFVGFCSSEEPPPGSYHELEKESQFADQKFVGGIQACVIVRYHQSPIGEYDELLWIPGAFKLPTCGKRTYRATRAYVSTPLAVYSGLCTNVLALVDILLQHAKTIYNSGRKNWNVPKAVRQ